MSNLLVLGKDANESSAETIVDSSEDAPSACLYDLLIVSFVQNKATHLLVNLPSSAAIRALMSSSLIAPADL